MPAMITPMSISPMSQQTHFSYASSAQPHTLSSWQASFFGHAPTHFISPFSNSHGYAVYSHTPASASSYPHEHPFPPNMIHPSALPPHSFQSVSTPFNPYSGHPVTHNHFSSQKQRSKSVTMTPTFHKKESMSKSAGLPPRKSSSLSKAPIVYVSEEEVDPKNTPEAMQCLWDGCHKFYAPLASLVRHIRRKHLVRTEIAADKAAQLLSEPLNRKIDKVRGTGGQRPMDPEAPPSDQQTMAAIVPSTIIAVYFCRWTNCHRRDRPFRQLDKIQLHMRTHTGERPYQCSFPNCGRSFSRQDLLTAHSRTHDVKRKMVCVKCGKVFYHTKSLEKHLRTAHDWLNITPEELEGMVAIKSVKPTSIRKARMKEKDTAAVVNVAKRRSSSVADDSSRRRSERVKAQTKSFKEEDEESEEDASMIDDLGSDADTRTGEGLDTNIYETSNQSEIYSQDGFDEQDVHNIDDGDDDDDDEEDWASEASFNFNHSS